jgi:diaminopimelate epimerase
MKAAARIPFVKAEACGNDFLIVHSSYSPENPAELSRRLCDRHLGIGADGVEWVTVEADGRVRARLINSDGSEAEISGNGTRCVAAWAIEDRGGIEVRILTGAGEKKCTLTQTSQHEYEFRMEMGTAEVLGQKTVSTPFGDMTGWVISLGNPHFVQCISEFPGNWRERAAAIERHPDFPHRTNVELVKLLGPSRIEFRIFERGVGETQSSGTGSCASAVAAISSGKVLSPVEVSALGGTQVVHWDRGDNLLLEGPARLICRGEFLL